MSETWVWLTLAAAGFQTLRFMLQKRLREAALSTAGATFARFLYSAPLVAVIAASYASLSGIGAPQLSPRFWSFALLGGTSQILATMCVVALFTHRNFAVGITFKKTEVLLSALFGAVLLGEGISGPALGAILIGFLGVLLLSDPPGGEGPWHRRVLNRATGLGIAAGILFGISGNGYRGASLALGEADLFYRAIVTLACVTAFQLVSMSLWLVWRERGEITRTLRAWRVAGLVGLTSMAGSICWFSAYAAQKVALVNALGQVELIFSLAVGAFVFGEKVTAREWQGLLLLTASITALVLLV